MLHSTDHAQFGYHLSTFDLVHEDANVGRAVSEMMQGVRAFMTTRLALPHLLLNLSFKHAGHPLFREVYDYAVKLDHRLASEMECCIVR